MSIKVPPDVDVVSDRRLTMIRLLSEFTKEGGRLEQLKAGVKKAMADKEAKYAQSDLALGHVVRYPARAFVDPRMLFDLIKEKRIKLDDFLRVVCVRTTLLPDLLSKQEIKAITMPAKGDGDDVLFTDFKPNVTVKWEQVEAAMLAAIEAH